jgi:hypothetical protein
MTNDNFKLVFVFVSIIAFLRFFLLRWIGSGEIFTKALFNTGM